MFLEKYIEALIVGLLLATIFLGSLYYVTHNGFVGLLNNYNALVKKWDNLVKECNATSIAYCWLNEPLEHKVIPTLEELKIWVKNDSTNDFQYDDPDYDCFHYAATLMLHGRAKHYDLGVVAMYGYRTSTGTRWFHVINVINTSEGLVYIEPQLDEVWFIPGHSEIMNGTSCELPGLGFVHVDEVKIIFDY